MDLSLSGKKDNNLRFHAKYCANRHWKIALIYVLASGFVLFAALRGYSHAATGTPPKRDAFQLFFDIYAIGVGGWIFIKFRCLRERIVIGVFAISLLRAVAIRLNPSLIPLASAVHLREANLLLWSTSIIISLSMLVSSIRYKEVP